MQNAGRLSAAGFHCMKKPALQAGFVLIQLYEFQIYDLSVVSLSRSELKSSCISAVSILILRCDLVEELSYNVLIEYVLEYLSSCVKVTLFCNSDQLLSLFLPSFL